MEDVRPGFVNQDPVLVVIVERVTADIRALVTDQDALTGVCRQPLRDCCAGKAGADDG